jgi:hypothetical protein
MQPSQIHTITTCMLTVLLLAPQKPVPWIKHVRAFLA